MRPASTSARLARRRFQGWGTVVVGLVVLAALTGWVTSSSIFAARSIAVSGNVHLTRDDVLRVAGVGPRTNLVWFSPGRVEDRLDRNPWVVSATVSRSLPSNLTITVVERRPVAVVAGARRYLVAGDRTVLGVVGTLAPFPVIDVGPRRFVLGTRISSVGPALAAVVGLPPALRSQVAVLRFDPPGTLVAVMRSGVLVIYGDGAQAALKGRTLLAVLAWAQRNQVTPASIDLRAPAQPSLRPADGTPATTVPVG